ncbi:MAG: hypothetical protein HY508_10895 [Acidobacteria bacterium]|nr:hypothetical protein [Acidobacteriota bacterium]
MAKDVSLGALSMAGFRPRKFVVVLLGCGLALTAWFLPSQFSAERYRRRLEAGLEALLHRPASFASASFHLLPQPGFALENVVIREDPAFGPEPFARIDHVVCDLRWSSFWHRGLDCARLGLTRPSFNIARDARGEWNLENFLVMTGVTTGHPLPADYSTPLPFDIKIEDARLNFKQGDYKKPFAIVELHGRLNFDPVRKRIRFNLTGNPVRMDIAFAPPGSVEISGSWSPGPDLSGAFDATLRTRAASLYNWVPLITGTDREIYGVMDADIRLRGSLRTASIEGECLISQIHRSDLPPPADPMPIRLRVRAGYDLTRGRLVVESAEAMFSDSSVHLTGTVAKIPEMPELDLVVALEHTQLEDWNRLARRLWPTPIGLTLAGRLDGLLTIQGHAGGRRYGGFIAGRGARLVTSAEAFPVSDLALRFDQKGARLDPVILTLAPRSTLAIEGALYPSRASAKHEGGTEPPRYELRLDTKSADLRDVVRFARALGISTFKTVDAQGLGNSTALLRGAAWPPSKPAVSVKAEIRSARLLIPGLTEPLNIPRARLQLTDHLLVIDSLTAVIGSSIFTGRVERSRITGNPWQFDLQANSLSVEEGAAWFDALGHRPSLALLERIPGLGSNATRRAVASGLFTSINARGNFSTPLLTYRSLRLQNFEASLSLSNRILGLSGVSFHAGRGRGEASAHVNLNQSPAQIAAEVKLETMADRLPPALRKARGVISGMAQIRTTGLSRSEMAANLEAEGRARLERVNFGDFDPLGAILRRTRNSDIDRPRREASVKTAEIIFGIRDRQVNLVNQQIDVDGTTLVLNGSWTLNGPLDLEVIADFRQHKRPWAAAGASQTEAAPAATLHLTGPLGEVQSQVVGMAPLASR